MFCHAEVFLLVFQNLNGRDSDSENELDKLEEIESCLQEHDPDFKKLAYATFTKFLYFLIIKSKSN